MSLLQAHLINLEMFEGPLDLLLFLIKRDELNIYDIPIARITRDYLEYVELAQELKLHVAGDFILMAATLMKIKARMLLPAAVSEDDEIEDPRNELMNMLLEYKRYKEAADAMALLEREERPHYYRLPAPWNPAEQSPGDHLEDVKLYDLMLTFQYLLKNYEEPLSHNVAVEEVSLAEQVAYLSSLLQSSAKIRFSQLIQSFQSRLLVVVTFLAILEMLRNHQIRVQQSQLFDDLLISKGRTLD